jgi:glucosamine--fructose-6-phosphate aminotransferase (isomerizing)
MCGIFGYVSKNGSGPSLAVLKRIAAETEARGRHAFGLAWVGVDGSIHTFRRPGPATANLGDLDRCGGTQMVVGHCRRATHGSPEDNRNNHPHAAGKGRFVHNGVVWNYRELTDQHSLDPQTACDSEVIGLLVAKARGRLIERVAASVAETWGPLAVLGLWAAPLRLVVVRRDNPLYFSETDSGFWFASQGHGLPGEPLCVKNNYVGIVTNSPKGLMYDTRRLA